MKRYEYDYLGTLPDNKFTEVRIVKSIDNTDRVIILEHAPFFPDIEIFVSGSTNPLKIGVDYELVHQLPELEQIATKDVFCGVSLLSPHATGKLKFVGQTVGGDFVDPLNGILDDLLKHLNAPKVGDFENVSGFPALVPKAQTYREWSDIVNTADIADAITDLSNSVGAGGNITETALAALVVNVNMLSATLDMFDYPSHVSATNPHATTATQLDAHPSHLAVSDTFMAYSKDFFSLCDYIRSRGMTETDIDKYMGEYLTGTVSGSFMSKYGVAVIGSEDRSAYFDLNGAGIKIVSKGHVFLQADFDTVSTGEYYQLVSGNNTLKIQSSGSGMGHDKITLNGVELIDNIKIKEYQGTDGGGDVTSIVTDSHTLIFTGDGSVKTPISARLILHKASESVDGCVRLKNTSGNETDGWAVTPVAAKQHKDDISLLVPNTRRLNDIELKGAGITLTKADCKLGNVDNTADISKPLSDDLVKALAAMTAKSHKHQWSEMGIGHSSMSGEGISLIANDINNLPINQAVEPYVLNIVKGKIDALRPKYNNSIIAAEVEFATVGGSAFGINKFVLTPQDPITYSISKAGVVRDGTFSGEIDFSTVKDDTWMSIADDCDIRWPKANARPMPTAAPHPSCKFIAPEPTWDLAGGSFAVKKRLLIPDGLDVSIIIVGVGSASFYIDGVEVGKGTVETSTIKVTLPPGRHTFGASCTNVKGPSGVAFVVLDGETVISGTDESWACSVLGENVDPTNNRFYIYGDVDSGKLIGKTTPINYGLVSGSYVFVGCVKTDYTAVLPNNGVELSFKSTIDYGIFSELTSHLNAADAHGGNNTNSITGLENIQGFGEAGGSTCLDTLTRSESQDTNRGDLEAARSLTISQCVSPRFAKTRIVQELMGHSPAKHHNVENTLADGGYTVEGQLHVRSDTPNTVKYLLIADAINDKHYTFEISYDVTTSSFTFRSYNIPYMTISAAVEEWSTETDIKPVTPTVVNSRDGVYNLFETDDSTLGQKYSLLKYRYNRETNVLSLLCGAGGKYTVADFIFGENVYKLLASKYIGVEGVGSMTLAGVLDAIDIPYTDLKRVTNTKGMLSCYLSGNDTSAYSEMGLGSGALHLDKGCLDGLGQWHGATEVTHYPRNTGEYFATHGQKLPSLLLKGDTYPMGKWPWAVVDLSTPTPPLENASWISPSLNWRVRETSETVRYRKSVTVTGGATTITIVSDDGHSVFLDGVLKGQGVNGVVKTHTFDVTAGTHIFDIDVHNLGGPGGAIFVIKCENVPVAKSDTSWKITKIQGQSSFTLETNPWHTCQAAWDMALTNISKE